jgi:hypothetical protein
MKPSSLVIVPLLGLGLAACSRPSEPARGAAAQPSPAAASAAPQSTAAGDSLPPAAEAPAVRAAATAPASEPRQQPEARRPAAPPAPAPAQPQQAEAQRPAPDAAPPARRVSEPLVLAEGTELPIRLTETVASNKSQPEQEILAELTQDVRANGRVALPAGSEVIGHVVVAQQSGRVKGRARLVIAFDEIRVRGRSHPIQATRWDVTAQSSAGRDAKIAGGAAAAGAIIGAIADGGSGALKGGAIGGAAGGAAVLATRGKEVELPSGTEHTLTLRQALRVE